MPWELKKLSREHILIANELAAGTKRRAIAEKYNITPEYVTMLGAQPLIKEKVKEFCEYSDTRMLALTEKSVDVIADILDTGANKDKLIAARLQLEAVNRVGKNSGLTVQLNQKFVIHVPAKAATTEDWLAQAAAARGGSPDQPIQEIEVLCQPAPLDEESLPEEETQ